MNCKQGDMALVTRGVDAGKMVTCFKLIVSDAEEVRASTGEVHVVAKKGLPAWRVDRELAWYIADSGERVMAKVAQDAVLMPIRPEPDNEAEKERGQMTLRIYKFETP